MNVPPRFAKRLTKLSKSTGIPEQQFLEMALEDWFLASADTYRNHTTATVKARARRKCNFYIPKSGQVETSRPVLHLV